MRGLLKILGPGLVAFIAIAMAQEWRLFASAWFGWQQTAPEMSEEDRRGAHEAVYRTLAVMAHLYSTEGDERFAERIPAGRAVVDEILADVAFVTSRGRVQVPELLRLEIAAVDPLRPGAAEVSTREYWRIRFVRLDGSGRSDPTREQYLEGRYLVVRGARGWEVEGWEYRLDAIQGDEADER